MSTPSQHQDDTKSTPSNTGAGNTNTAPKTRGKNWFFTWNNYPDTFDTTLSQAFKGSHKYAYQEEKGLNGTKHIQGCVSFTNAREFNSLKKIDKGIHWEKTRNMEKAINYCTKDETRNGIRKTSGIPKIVKDPLEGKQLYPWQEQIINELQNEPHPRQINWIWEEKGCTGKTTLCKHLCIKQKALYVNGKSADIKCAVATMLEQGNEPRIVLWDIPRTQKDYLSYSAIEEIKNGLCFSGKYESKQLIFNIPHIYIFANFAPDQHALSSDRWRLIPL